MKLQLTWLTSMLVLLPALVQAQGGGAAPASPAATKAPTATPTVGFSREKATDICTTEPRSEWLTEEEMKLLAQHRGYRIKTFKLAKGNCYEVYGFDRDGRIVEAYFNPVTSKLMRQNIAR